LEGELMISVADAVKILRNPVPVVIMDAIYANQIADLIEHLSNKCDLEVNELLQEEK